MMKKFLLSFFALCLLFYAYITVSRGRNAGHLRNPGRNTVFGMCTPL